jgi:carbon storage regulator
MPCTTTCNIPSPSPNNRYSHFYPMLILSRKVNECIIIDSRIIVKVVRVEGQIVKLGIQAPADVPVHRQEIYDEIQRNNQEAMTRMRMELPRLPKASPGDAAASPAPPAIQVPPPPAAPPAEPEKAPVAQTKETAATTEEDLDPVEPAAPDPVEEKKTTKTRSSTSAAKSGTARAKRSKSTASE